MILFPSLVCEAFISLFLLPHEVAAIIRVLPTIIDHKSYHISHSRNCPSFCSCPFDAGFISFVNADGALLLRCYPDHCCRFVYPHMSFSLLINKMRLLYMQRFVSLLVVRYFTHLLVSHLLCELICSCSDEDALRLCSPFLLSLFCLCCRGRYVLF